MKWLALALLTLAAGPAHGAASLTATIRDAWWSNQTDSDADGCFEGSSRLNWDPNVAGGNGALTVFEKLYFKKSTTNVWTLFRITANHAITNTITTDQQFVDVPLDGGACLAWDYQIEIYRTNQSALADYSRNPTNDADLANHREEAACSPQAILAGAWWSNQTDSDGNGCFEGTARLNWDANVSCGGGSLTVYEKVFFKLAGTNLWILCGTNPTHLIAGTSSNDAQSMDIELDGGACLAWDYKIEIETLRNGHFVTDFTLGPGNDPDLSAHREEAPPCAPLASISASWWTNRIDSDADGCFEDNVRLCWDPDESCGQGQMVFEKIYYQATGTTNWLLYNATAPHWIVGADTADQQSLDLLLHNPVCQAWDYKIELYRLGQPVPDDTHDPGNDPGLSAQRGKASKPSLTIAQSSNKVIVSWETNWAGYALETSSNLVVPVSWVSAGPLPGLAGNRYAATNTISVTNRFYRLKKP